MLKSLYFGVRFLFLLHSSLMLRLWKIIAVRKNKKTHAWGRHYSFVIILYNFDWHSGINLHVFVKVHLLRLTSDTCIVSTLLCTYCVLAIVLLCIRNDNRKIVPLSWIATQRSISDAKYSYETFVQHTFAYCGIHFIALAPAASSAVTSVACPGLLHSQNLVLWGEEVSQLFECYESTIWVLNDTSIHLCTQNSKRKHGGTTDYQAVLPPPPTG